jgi:hypothetical protein
VPYAHVLFCFLGLEKRNGEVRIRHVWWLFG